MNNENNENDTHEKAAEHGKSEGPERLRAAAAELRDLLPRPRPALPAPQDCGRLLGVVTRTGGELRIVFDDTRGAPYLSFRLWRYERDGWTPSRGGGFSLRLGELADVATAVAAALEAAKVWAEEHGR